jgi:feruloyl esterase
MAGLRHGYATSSTNTGHDGASTDASFAAGHPEKLVDLAYRAVHEMTVQAKAIVAAYYGSAPRPVFGNGCSTGGRQALIEVQRYRPRLQWHRGGRSRELLVTGPVWGHVARHRRSD